MLDTYEDDVSRYRQLAEQIAAIPQTEIDERFSEQLQTADRMGIPRAQANYAIRQQLLTIAGNADMEMRVGQRQKKLAFVAEKVLFDFADLILVLAEQMNTARKKLQLVILGLEGSLSAAAARVEALEAASQGVVVLRQVGPTLTRSATNGNDVLLATFDDSGTLEAGLRTRRFNVHGSDITGALRYSGEISIRYQWQSGVLQFQSYQSYDLVANAGALSFLSPDNRRLEIVATSTPADMTWTIQEMATDKRRDTGVNPIY